MSTLGEVAGDVGAAASAGGHPRPIAFAPWDVRVALRCAIAIGLIFGISPARRAARLDPAAALATG